MASALVAVLVAYAPAEATTAQDTLKQPPFAPTDRSLFSHAVYPDTPADQPASSGPTDEATLRQNLSDLLSQRFSNNPKTVKQALATFDSDKTKQIVPDPRLRAAIVALKGTAGEPAIAGILDGTYSHVTYNPTFNDAIAQVLSPQDTPDGNSWIIVNPKYKYEDFRQLAPTFAHEPLHRDDTVSNKEELIAHSIHILVYGQFLLGNPELATSGTELAWGNNTELMARINSHDANGNLRLLTSTGADLDGIFPGGNYVPFFDAPFEPHGNDTPGNTVVKGELKKVLGKGVKVPKKPNFDDKTVNLLDQHEGLLSPEQIVQLAQILKLDTSPPSAAAQAQRAQEGSTASNQPVPDWREIFGEQ